MVSVNTREYSYIRSACHSRTFELATIELVDRYFEITGRLKLDEAVDNVSWA